MVVWRRARALGLGWAGLLVAVLAAAGCSGTGAAAEDSAPGRAPEEILRRAADVLVEAGSSQTRTAMRMASGGTRITLHGEGGFDYARRTGQLRVTLPEGKPVTEIFVPGRLYMKNRGAGVPADKWVRVDIAELPDGNLVTGGATDPITAAELLRGVRSVADLGDAEVDGERVRHYRGVTDIVVAARATPGWAGERLAAAATGFTRTEVPFDAYLDARGLLREVRHRFSFAGPADPEDPRDRPRGIDVDSTVTLFDFGTPVTVTLPEPHQVYTGAVA